MPRIPAPESGVAIRMYRQGHGDCFLLTMRGENAKPFHILIDCGFKPGSEIRVPVEDVINDIVEATDGHLDVLMITHEHQDHVNLFTAKLEGKRLFDDIDVDELWLGWTANPKDKVADEIRQGHDKAVGMLVEARRLARRLGAVGLTHRLDEMLAFEGFGAGATGETKSKAKIAPSVAEAMRYVLGKVPDEKRRKYFDPHNTLDIKGVSGMRVISLGPPKSRGELNKDEPTKTDEMDRVYGKEHGLSFGFTFGLGGILAAAADDEEEQAEAYQPFARDLELRRHGNLGRDPDAKAFLDYLYPASAEGKAGGWRRIEDDWLFALDWFARKINVEVNNSSLVIAIEMVKSRKVLLFAGDAQYGNWLSWDDRQIRLDDGSTTTVKELLGRVVLYKVGHHGSHNATLKGEADSEYPNLSWLAQGDFADEFTAMIPANEPWAVTEKADPKWIHPLPAIRKALDEKAEGRVFQSDIAFKDMKRSDGGAVNRWNQFTKRSRGSDGQELYFDYWIPDE